jgi:hypothetical protein
VASWRSHAKIETRYHWRVLGIKLRLWRRIALLQIAGWLTKLAWKISPDFEKHLRDQIIREHFAKSDWELDDEGL